MPDQENIDRQLEWLAELRRTLADYLMQQATLGRDGVSSETANGIHRTREQIQETKARLRSWNVPVEEVTE